MNYTAIEKYRKCLSVYIQSNVITKELANEAWERIKSLFFKKYSDGGDNVYFSVAKGTDAYQEEYDNIINNKGDDQEVVFDDVVFTSKRLIIHQVTTKIHYELNMYDPDVWFDREDCDDQEFIICVLG